ncbi:MAG: hypothetical protein Q7R56_00820 [Nanoarchaeota archaeon]|nr:hypothetical protein [Nanoarchaeota archaeon]
MDLIPFLCALQDEADDFSRLEEVVVGVYATSAKVLVGDMLNAHDKFLATYHAAFTVWHDHPEVQHYAKNIQDSLRLISQHLGYKK